MRETWKPLTTLVQFAQQELPDARIVECTAEHPVSVVVIQ